MNTQTHGKGNVLDPSFEKELIKRRCKDMDKEGSKYDRYIRRRKLEWGKKFSSKRLSKQFIPHFNEGNRIEVKMESGEVLRGTIGVTTGWVPSFILMLRIDSTGSPYLLTDNDTIVKVVRRGRE